MINNCYRQKNVRTQMYYNYEIKTYEIKTFLVIIKQTIIK